MLHLSRPTCGILETGCMAVYNMMMNIFKCLFYAAQGYSVQYLFEGFMLPKRSVSRYQSMKCNKWLAGSVWIVTEMMADLLFSRVNRKPQFTIMDIVQSGRFKIGKTLLCSIVLYLFCLCWYQGKWLLKLFLVIQFLSLRQLSIWTGFSLNLLGQRKLSQLEHAFLEGKLQMTEFVQYAELAGLCSVVVVWLLQCTVLILFIRKIVKSFCCWEPERLNREAAIYLLPAVTGLLLDLLLRMMMITIEEGRQVLLYKRYPVSYFAIPVIAIVLMLAIVFSFQSCQEMAAIQRARAEKIVLENQMIQMRAFIAETEQMYRTMRSVRHDIKNHLLVLRQLMLQKFPAADTENEKEQEIWCYFEDICHAVGQLDNQIHTGNAVSDAIIHTKFSYARKMLDTICLNAEAFAVPASARLKAYDLGIILNNGLDNAIEACVRLHRQKPETRLFITIRSFCVKNMFFIEIENSFDGAILLDKDSGFPITTKEDKEVHGIGLKNIRNCAANYDGGVDCIIEKETFTLSVMVASAPNKDEEKE